MVRRIVVKILVAVAMLGGIVGFAGPASAATSCTAEAVGSNGARARCVFGVHWVLVNCRRAANGVAYYVTGPTKGSNNWSYAYCASGDLRTSYENIHG
jgi:hypothetical protein